MLPFVFDPLVTLVAGSEARVITVHKGLLIWHSNHFCAAYLTDCDEARNNRFVLKHFTVGAVQHFVRWLYTRDLTALDHHHQVSLDDGPDDDIAAMVDRELEKDTAGVHTLEIDEAKYDLLPNLDDIEQQESRACGHHVPEIELLAPSRMQDLLPRHEHRVTTGTALHDFRAKWRMLLPDADDKDQTRDTAYEAQLHVTVPTATTREQDACLHGLLDLYELAFALDVDELAVEVVMLLQARQRSRWQEISGPIPDLPDGRGPEVL